MKLPVNRTVSILMPKTKWKKKKRPILSQSFIAGLLIIFISLILVCGCSRESSGDFHEGIISPRFSIDNKKIIFGYCSGTKKDTKCDLVTYEMATQNIYRFKPTGNKSHGSPVYSPDGKRIAFASGNNDNERNIYLADADGSSARQLTNRKVSEAVANINDANLRFDSMPSFSPDGKRVIFMRAAIRRERAFPLSGKMLSHWDAYEVDIKTGVERRLTNYAFYDKSKPSYMPDGKRFIFSATGKRGEERDALKILSY